MKTNFKNLIALLLVFVMCFSIVACNPTSNNEQTTPAETTPAAPAETTTQAPEETTTAAPAETTTEAPAETTTEVPAETTTEAPIETTTPPQAAQTILFDICCSSLVCNIEDITFTVNGEVLKGDCYYNDTPENGSVWSYHLFLDLEIGTTVTVSMNLLEDFTFEVFYLRNEAGDILATAEENSITFVVSEDTWFLDARFDENFVPGIGDGGDEEYDYIVIASAEHGGSTGFLGYVHMYINDSFGSGYDNSVAYGLNEGDKVTLWPEANSGYVFAGWYYEAAEGGLGEFITLDKEYTFEVSGNAKYIAHFVNANEKFPVGIMVSGYGNVSVDGGEYNSSYNLKINAMQTIELTAKADAGNKFVGWYVDDEFYSADKTINVCVDFAKHIEAKFEGEWILFGAYVNEDGYTGADNPQNQFLIVRTSPHTGERETIAVDHDRVFSLQYGDVVELIAKPMEGYTFGAFRFDEIDGEFFGHDGYYKWTVDKTEDNSIIQAFFQPVGKSEEDVTIHVDFVDLFGSDCDDCYIYLNGVKVTKQMAASQSFMTKDQTKITIVPVECGHCEGFRYYMPQSGTIAGNVETGNIIWFQMSTAFCRKTTWSSGDVDYDFYFDICFGYEQVTADVTFGVDIEDGKTGFDVRFENVMFGGEKTTIEDTQDLFFGAVLGDTVRITPLNIPKGYKFNYIEVTIEYEAVEDDVVYKTIILDADDFANGYCDFKIEYPGHYNFYVSVTAIVN